jgi:CheY-like chemotaxis protein
MFDKIGIMEDNRDTLQKIKSSLKDLGYEPIIVKNAQEALNTAKKGKCGKFIFDIHMGKDREQEGLTALELIKSFNENIFVGILSGYPNYYRQMANRLQADFFQEKTDDQSYDIFSIVKRILTYQEKLVRNNINLINGLLGYSSEQNAETDDINYISYQKLRSDSEWMASHSDHYIALLSGEIVAKDTDRDRILLFLEKKYPDSKIFFTKVEQYETIIDIPAPLSVSECF